MNGGLAIFVKTPGHSALKTRLAADCGTRYAEQWHTRAAGVVASVAQQAQAQFAMTGYWAVAERGACDQWPGLPVLAQGGGGLGARMARVHAQLVADHGFGVLVGADTPQITVDLLGQATDWLANPAPRLLLGPASDGGFWLFGANVVPPLEAWTSVAYSAADTAHALQRSMQALGDWRTLTTLSDLDTVADLATVRRALQALPAPTPEQRTLAFWMRDSTDRDCTDRDCTNTDTSDA